MGNLTEYMIFILIILFIHLIVLITQAISGSHYFYGVYIKNIELGKDIKKEIDKHFKKKLNIGLSLVIVIYLLAGFIFNINIGTNI